MPEFYYKLLQRICEKPYIDYQGLEKTSAIKKDLDFQQGLDFSMAQRLYHRKAF